MSLPGSDYQEFGDTGRHTETHRIEVGRLRDQGWDESKAGGRCSKMAPKNDSGQSPEMSAARPTDLRPRRWALLGSLARLYGASLVAVLLIRFGLRDRTWWSFAVSSLLPYAFLPAPLLLPAAWLGRRRDLYAIFTLAALVWACLWGGRFMPRSTPAHAAGSSFRVMTYNVLGFNFDTLATMRVIREADADVVVLQELNLENAAAIEKDLGSRYPYRWLDPSPGVVGGGIISRYPFRQVSAGPADQLPWVGKLMAVEVQVGQRTVTLLRYHAFAGPERVREREEQARGLAEVARTLPGPLIFAGDLNATDQNTAHATITSTMRDSWLEAGWGFGHTFPGEPTAAKGGSRPVVFGVPVPLWLVRIDYIFHSAELVALDAHIGPSDGTSDHRPVLVTLAFP
jgi:vancomycin resistance protein VanJ